MFNQQSTRKGRSGGRKKKSPSHRSIEDQSSLMSHDTRIAYICMKPGTRFHGHGDVGQSSEGHLAGEKVNGSTSHRPGHVALCTLGLFNIAPLNMSKSSMTLREDALQCLKLQPPPFRRWARGGCQLRVQPPNRTWGQEP